MKSDTPSHHGYRFPPEIINHAVWLPVSPLRCEPSRCRRSPGRTRPHGVLRSDPAVVPHVRFGIRSPAQASTGPAGRHLAAGRGLHHHPGTAALSLACRRSRWRRHRYPRPVASRLAEDLRRRGAVPKENGTSFVLSENVDPWPHAFVLDSAAEHMPRLRLPGCANDRLLCIDLAPLAERRSTDGLLITHQNGRIDVRLSPAAESRLLVVSQMFRRDWVAFTDDSPLTTVPAFGGLIGVRVPPRISSIQLRYRPVMVMRATGLAWSTLVAGFAALVVLRRTGRRSAPGRRGTTIVNVGWLLWDPSQ